MTSQFVDAWRRNNEVNLYLLDQMNPKQLGCKYSERTRTVAAQFAHTMKSAMSKDVCFVLAHAPQRHAHVA